MFNTFNSLFFGGNNLSNWYFGWSSILLAFATGAAIGLFFHRDEWLNGYSSFSRRMLRLGHIAQAALGMLNVLAALAQTPNSHELSAIGSWSLIVGGIAMPTVCFLSAWRKSFRHLFFIPVIALITGVVEVIKMGPP
ncbi:MAG: hypothetical protein R3C03_01175 [Pirellulaceae bacterium]